MSDLEVATDELRALGTRLGQLSSGLKSLDGEAEYDTSRLAHSDVVDGMNEFRDNWDDNRDHLADKLAKIGDLATQTGEGFEEADAKLATEIRKAVEERG